MLQFSLKTALCIYITSMSLTIPDNEICIQDIVDTYNRSTQHIYKTFK